MTCNHERFLREQEVTCLRQAKAANEGPTQEEWLRTAEMLIERRKAHILTCQKCLPHSKS